MGDRCCVWIQADDETIRLFADEWGEPDEDDDTHMWWEVNYGGTNVRDRIASMGKTFIGKHSEGGCYPACRFVAYKGKQIEVPVDHDDWAYARVDMHGKVDDGMIEDIKAFNKIREKAEKDLDKEV